MQICGCFIYLSCIAKTDVAIAKIISRWTEHKKVGMRFGSIYCIYADDIIEEHISKLCPPSWKNYWNNVVGIDVIKDQQHK